MQILDKSHDALTGVTTIMGIEDNKFVVKSVQDVEPHFEHTQALTNDEEYSRQGIKKGWWHAAHIPDSVCLKMITEDGFNPYTAHAKEIRLFLRRNAAKYRKLIVTRKQI